VKVTRVRIEYDDGSAREVVGVDDCEKWTTLVNAHTTLWLSRGWWDPPTLVNWREIPATKHCTCAACGSRIAGNGFW
jgi:hypothetical protein